MRYIPLATLLFLLSFASSGIAAPTVLFDQGHGQAFTIEQKGELQLGELAALFRADGWQVASSSGAVTPQLLQNVDALVISGAFKPFAPAEIEAIANFVAGGGRLTVMLHIAPPLVPLLHRFGVVTANGVVQEGSQSLILDGQALNFKVANLQNHPLNQGLTHFSLYGGWPLLPQGENTLSVASTSPTAWVDLDRDKVLSLNDAVQEFSVLVTGKVDQGEFAVFADDAIFQNRFLKGVNVRLAKNLSRWLLQGTKKIGVEI